MIDNFNLEKKEILRIGSKIFQMIPKMISYHYNSHIESLKIFEKNHEKINSKKIGRKNILSFSEIHQIKEKIIKKGKKGESI